MKIKDFAGLTVTKFYELNNLVRSVLPVKIGAMAKRHFQDSFRNGGFTDQSLQPWPKSRRLEDGSDSARDQNPTLLSSRKHLFSSIKYTTRPGAVRITNDVKYAAIHNEGGQIPITRKMRRFAWAKYFEAAGIERKPKQYFAKKQRHSKSGQPAKPIPPGALKWKRLALTKKTAITMPKRQFMGDSAVLRKKIGRKIESEITKLLKNG